MVFESALMSITLWEILNACIVYFKIVTHRIIMYSRGFSAYLKIC